LNAPQIPILGNIGAAQIVKMDSLDKILFIADMIEADAMVVHLNPAQELMQLEGEPDFSGLLKKLEKLVKILGIPVIAKEVGAGISKKAAEKLLNAGVKGIDVAGAGGTSWTGVEILRNKNGSDEFWDWGLPTSFCIKTVHELKKKYKFYLIGSGGINNGFDAAKAYALGADIAASARIILKTLFDNGIEGVENLIRDWFNQIKKIMFLTGSSTLSDLRKDKLLIKETLF
jgi:isopentenyl-diphosphate delta-isomerase